MLIDIPAHCPSCNALYASGFVIESDNEISFVDCGSICPYCSSMGRLIGETFDFVGNVLTITAVAPEAVELLRRFQAAIVAAANATSGVEAAERAGAVLPEVKGDLSPVGAASKGVLIALLLAAMTSCSNMVKIDGKLDINDLLKQIREISGQSKSVSEPSKEPSQSSQPTSTPQPSGRSRSPGKTPSPDGSTPIS